MAQIGAEPRTHPLLLLRVVWTTIGAVAAGVVNAVAGRQKAAPVTLRPGDLAPEFSLPASNGRRYRLSELRGKPIVLAWFPKAFTGGCTVECRSLGQSGETVRQLGAQLFGASVDSVDANAAFAESLGLDYPILSDRSREAARAYGVLSASGYASRCTFYIDGHGRIAAIDRRVTTSTHGRDVAARLQTLDLS
jgi:peroxiredoxin Q/BCP